MFRSLGLIVLLFLTACASNDSIDESKRDPLELAKIYYEKALYSDAERILLGLDESMPDNYDINFRLGNIYVRTGQFPAAEIRYLRCIEIDSAEPKAWYNLTLLKVKEAVALAEEGQQKTMLTDEAFSRRFALLRDGLIKAITGK